MRKLYPRPTQVDIFDSRDNIVATAFRLTSGNWLFRDLEMNWQEESEGPLQLDQLADIYLAIRKRRGQEFREAKSKGK